MAKAKTAEFWLQVQTEYEEGASVKALADKYDISEAGIRKKRADQEWQIPGDDPAEDNLDDIDYHDEEREAALLEEIAALEAKLADAEAKAEELNPVKSLKLYETAAEVLEFHGEDAFREIAYKKIAAENLARAQGGLPTFDWERNADIVEQKIQELAQEMVTRRNRPPSDLFRQRVVKMIRPDGNIVQWPVEEQVSNEAGQAGAAIWKAKEKGWKLVDPYICQVHDCWIEAEANEHGELTLDGYCTPAHRALDPYLQQNHVGNVATSKAVQF